MIIDLNDDNDGDDHVSPESQGVIGGCVYLMILFCFIPIQFSQYKSSSSADLFTANQSSFFDHHLVIDLFPL